MKRMLAVFFILGSSITGIAQEKSFDLSKYKFPDYKRHELEFNFSSNGSTDKSESFYNEQYYKSTSSKNHSNADIGYTFNSLSRKKVDYLHSSISGIFDLSKNKSYSATDATKNIDLNTQLQFNWDRQVYWKEDKWFLDITSQVNYNLQKNNKKYPQSDSQKDVYQNINLGIGFGIGFGRIESVSDLVQSWYILSKLKKQKSLARELEEKDIFEFAKFAAKLKNKRFFDSRLREIAELQALDSVLHTSGLIENNDISYFTTLNDLWSYGSFGRRYSGNTLTFLLDPEYSTSITKTYSAENKTIESTTYGGQNLRFVSFKQLNLFWDCNFFMGLHNRTFINQTSSSEVSSITRQSNLFNANAGFGFGFYPDSRTSISLSFGYYGNDQPSTKYDEQTGIVEIKSWANNINSSIKGIFYISPQFQITGDIGLNYYNNNDSYKSKYFTTSYNLGLRYAIF